MTTSSPSTNPHLMDATLLPFLSPAFSPVDYLNSTLLTSTTGKQHQPTPSLSAIASQTQSHISTLNAQTTRLSTILTSLTDDILRTSSRLAYEVELLRGEALSLADSLSSRGALHETILKFTPDGLENLTIDAETPSSPSRARHGSQGPLRPQPSTAPSEIVAQTSESTSTKEPDALPHLRTLLHVRAQLQIVIQRFNLALSFPLPPSLLTTTTSSLISVNPPNQDPDLESKGQAALARLKQEVIDLLADAEGRGDGVQRAADRVRELRELCVIWKGTGEERARIKWIDGLESIVDDEARKKEEGRKKGGGGRLQEVRREPSTARNTNDVSGSGPGFLRRLREEIYME